MDEILKKYSPAAIANNFLWLAKEDGVRVTPMKLLKLVYFAYGWSLALLGRKVFDENTKIQAWKHGPVIPSLYYELQRFGSSPIDTFASDTHYNEQSREIESIFPVVDPDDKGINSIIGAIWKHYKNYSAWQLSTLTHEEDSPWSKAYAKGPYSDLDDRDITIRSLDAIKKVYEGKP